LDVFPTIFDIDARACVPTPPLFDAPAWVVYTNTIHIHANAPWKKEGEGFQALSKVRGKISLLIVTFISSAI